eukprot:6465835-Amphidinium_carterae.2
MVAPPHTHLASTAAVAEFYVAGDERLYFSGQDIADAFYQFAIPWELSKYLGLPPVRAGALDVSMVEGKRVSPDTLIVPLATENFYVGLRLAVRMMSCWTVVLLPSCQQVIRLNWSMWTMSYLSPTMTEIRGLPELRLMMILGGLGLPFHEVEENVPIIESIGLELNGIECFARANGSKRSKLASAWKAIARKPYMSGAQLEVLVGHLTHVMLLNRPTLSVFSSVYSFIRRYRHRTRTLWRSVYSELRAAFGLLPLLVVSWRMPFSLTLNCSDASTKPETKGFAVHETEWDSDEVQQVYGHSDRWRFLCDSSWNFRGEALAKLCKRLGVFPSRERQLLRVSETTHETLDESEVENILTQEGIELAPGFEDVSFDSIFNHAWSLVHQGHFSRAEAIHVKEMRALAFALRRRVRSARGFGMKHVPVVVDSSVVSLAVSIFFTLSCTMDSVRGQHI